ncbi:M23 family metallopeptidase [Fictibacillus nanhaiensis]|uniref:M23 family metallopeptidase n=1 Tax=Fictibacillus nanhaiensis TaxID=742169 RepID=UPI002E225FE9|nr:M23 family metallopeptidase [Fictibacillus nanhaiensis]
MKYNITSKFQQHETFRSHGHNGLDLAMPNHSPLRSLKDGTISKIVDYKSQNVGKGIFVKWEDGKTAIYGHLSEYGKYKVGDSVRAGDIIGYSGNSGHVVGRHGGYHLHFGLKEDGRFIDPSPYSDALQHMNDPSFLNKLIAKHETVSQKNFSFSDWFNNDIYSSFMEIKLNLINLLFSIDYSLIIEHFQNLFKLFS